MPELITVDELMDEFRYEEYDRMLVKRKYDTAIQVLKNADAYDENSDLTSGVLSLMVGFFLENREGFNKDVVDIKDFPLSVQGLINSLRYSKGSDSNG